MRVVVCLFSSSRLASRRHHGSFQAVDLSVTPQRRKTFTHIETVSFRGQQVELVPFDSDDPWS